MKWTNFGIIILLTISTFACKAQNQTNMDKNNPLLCNPESGVCEMPGVNSKSSDSSELKSASKPIKIVYFTDPICSSCWGIEPQLRKLKLEYGHLLDIEYRMGGLLPDWSYNSGGISKPSDVAHHWDEVSLYYDMPIDGDVWLEDPLHSSYPPSIAFKAAEIQDHQKAILFMRAIREMVFLQKKNITKMEHLELAAKEVGLDVEKFKKDFESTAKDLFQQDLKLARELGVRGFPTIFIADSTGKSEMVYGTKPYSAYEMAIKKIAPNTEKLPYDHNWEFLFTKYKSLTAKEFSELSGKSRSEAEQFLNELTSKKVLTKLTTKNGSIWTKTE